MPRWRKKEIPPGRTGAAGVKRNSNVVLGRDNFRFDSAHGTGKPDTATIKDREMDENHQAAEDEVEALKSIYGDENVLALGDGKVKILIQNDVEGRGALNLTVEFHDHYPSLRAPGFSLYADWLSEVESKRAHKKLLQIFDEEQGSPILYSWVEWLAENIRPPPAIHISNFTEAVSRSFEEIKSKSSKNERVILGRRVIYSHHIIAQSKRTTVKNLAEENELGGLSKIGWPGAIIVEGEESKVQAYVDALKKLRWKHLAVRGEEIVKGSPGQSLDSLRAFPKSFKELKEDQMHEFASECKSAGLETLFLTFIKKKGSATSSDKSKKLSSVTDDCQKWVTGETLVDRKSVFQAHVMRVESREEVRAAMDKLLTKKKIAKATHNISAFRFQGATGIVKDCDDDGEAAAGGRLLHMMDLSNVEGVLVVVSRWYGGILLGPDRFRHINNVARQLLEAEGYIRGKRGAGSKKKK
ncbi:hypothetical protein AAMO2058_000466800 [Amorphochlora amoebiformis]